MLALRPAWASCTAGTAPRASMKRVIGFQAAAWPSCHSPVSAGEILPSGDTALASAITTAAPPTARLPRWTRCQSLGKPSVAEYWHIGDRTSRLRNSSERWRKGVNRWLKRGSGMPGWAGEARQRLVYAPWATCGRRPRALPRGTIAACRRPT